MDEMVTRYIFKHMRITESRLEAIAGALAKQIRINKSIKLFAFAVTLNLVIAEYERMEQNKRITKLEREIEELKRSEGE